jgi:hypothetical protein
VFSGVSIVPAGDPILLLDAVRQAGAEHLLVVAPPVLTAPLHTGLAITGGRCPELSLSWLTSEHSPLAILSALMLARAATDAPAVGIELTRRLLANSWSGAWTESVAKLNRPNPRLMQHLRSLLPGSGFLIRQAPDPVVLAKPRPDDVPPAGLARVLLVQDSGVPQPIIERLSQSDSVTAVRQVALPGVWASVYGTEQTGQVALMPAEPARLNGPITHRCPACLLDLLSPVCPFCRVVAREARAAPASQTLPPGLPPAGPVSAAMPTVPVPKSLFEPPPALARRSGRRSFAHPAQPGGPA